MIINRIDINPNLVIPEACRGSCMVKKTLKSSKTCVKHVLICEVLNPKIVTKWGPTFPQTEIIPGPTGAK